MRLATQTPKIICQNSTAWQAMHYPNFNEEKNLWKKGFQFVVGLDEAGRGPLAGPVVAAAVCIKNPNGQTPMTNKIINHKSQKRFRYLLLRLGTLGINDSKKLSAKKREQIYDIITTHANIEWGIGIVSEKVIDKINILEATKLAMQKAVLDLQKKMKYSVLCKIDDRRFCKEYDFLVLDGNFKIKTKIMQKSIIKGDQKVISISAASIIAKVTRDKIMEKFHKKYPQYGFDKHKGYGTELHMVKLKKYGICKIHRKSFAPINQNVHFFKK